MKRKLVVATNNAHKLEEVAAILGDQIELLSLNDIGCHTDIPETAETLEGNALLKSSFIFKDVYKRQILMFTHFLRLIKNLIW